MRRLLHILMLLFVGLPFVSPLLALSGDADAGLPACCRRNGAHHCGMTAAERVSTMQDTEKGSRERAVASPWRGCPYLPAVTTVAANHHDASAPGRAARQLPAPAVHPSGVVQTESRWRIARDRSRQKRGPPIFFA